MSVLLALGCLSGCANSIWEETDTLAENGGVIILSPEGEEYYFAAAPDYYLDGYEIDKKIGKIINESSGKIQRVYSIKGVDGEKFVAIENVTDYVYWESGPEYYICTRAGEEFFDYEDSNVSGIAFIASGEFTDVDCLEYIEKNGIHGDDAKALVRDMYAERTEDTYYHDILGYVVYCVEDAEWFCFRVPLRYSEEYGYYLSKVATNENYGDYFCYLLSDSVVETLGIAKE